MGKYNYESLKTAQETKETQSKKDFPKIWYFSLWEEKPSAIVRFDVSSMDDLDIVDVHHVKVVRDGKTFYREVACLRENNEPFKNCPLCENNIKTRSTKVFVRMLEYRIVDGKVVAVPVTWSRFQGFADEVATLLNQYGDLREHLFKVTFDKSSGKSKYTILYQPDMGIYTEAGGYVKDFSAFDNFMMNKHSYMERTFEELTTFVKTGVMASRKPKEEQEIEARNIEALTGTPEQEAQVEETLSAKEEVVADVTTQDEVKVEEPTTAPRTREVPVANSDDPTVARRRRYDFN